MRYREKNKSNGLSHLRAARDSSTIRMRSQVFFAAIMTPMVSSPHSSSINAPMQIHGISGVLPATIDSSYIYSTSANCYPGGYIGESLIDRRSGIEQTPANFEKLKAGGAAVRRVSMSDAEPNRLLTATELAERLKITRAQVYRLRKKGKIPGYWVGSWRFSLREVLAHITDKQNGLDT
jgi:excisionase family DNA binding protein